MEYILNLLKISVIVGCVVLALILLKPVLNRRYHAKWKYYVWLLLALALLLPLSPLGRMLSAMTEEHAPIQITVPDIDRRYREAGEMVQTAPAVSIVPVEPVGGGTAVQQTPQTQPPQQTLPMSRPKASAEEVAVLVWVMGMAAFAAYYAVGTAVFYRRSKRWSVPAGEAAVRRVEELMTEMGIRRKIPVLVSSVVTSPMMIGFFRPKLLLNEDNYAPRDLDFILRHELTHYQRRDLWYKLALLTANCVHWFNPFAWLMVREAAVDMELSCDDAVVAGGDASVRRAYSETLLASLHRQSGVNAALSTFFYGGKETMKMRFRNIMGLGRRRKGIAALCVVLSVTIAAACLIGCRVKEDEDKTGENEAVTLSAEELADWQEKLDSVRYNGFVTHMYSEAKYIRLNEVLYLGAGLEHAPSEEEKAAYLAESGMEELYTDLEAVSADKLEAYLQETVGLPLEEFAAPLGWTYVAEYDSYYFMHGDTNYAGVKVLSGERLKDTVTLELQDLSGATHGGTMTVVDDRIVSYTNPLYSAVEAMVQDYLLDAADPDNGSGKQSVRDWMERIWVGGGIPGEKGTYYFCSFNLVSEYDEVDEMMAEWAPDGVVRRPGGLLVRMAENGTVTQLEGHYGNGADWGHLYMDFTQEEYVRYQYEQDLYLMARMQGWPALKGQLIYAIHAGAKEWTQKAETVAEGWCLSMGDELAEYEVIERFEPGTEHAKADVLAQIVTAQGRTVRLLLSRVATDFHDVTYWEVLGHRLISGQELPKERVGEDTRSESPTLSITIEGMEEQVPCYLFTGGGDYGIGEWSMYLPYENWSCNFLTNRWCPLPEDMSLSIQVLEHGGHYSYERFYQSYAEQFDKVWTNERELAQGANTAHALGYQNTAGGRYTESFLYEGNGKFYEVMWTYSAEQAEGWGARLRWTAATFGVIGDDMSYEMGELRSVTDNSPETVVQERDRAGRAAGTYMILPRTQNAYRLEDYLDVAKGVAEITSLYGYVEEDGTGMKLYRAESGGEPVYLGIAHDGSILTEVIVVRESEVQAPDIRVLGQTILGMLEEKAKGEPKLVTADGGDPYVAAGTYMVLPESNAAFRLEGYITSWAEGQLRERRNVAPEDGYGDIVYHGFEWKYTYPGENGKKLLVFLADWGITVENEESTMLVGGMYVEDGIWYRGYPEYLIVEHDGENVTGSFVMMENDCFPGDETFTNDLNNRLAAGITVHTTRAAVFYDRVTGEIYAVHSNPALSA